MLVSFYRIGDFLEGITISFDFDFRRDDFAGDFGRDIFCKLEEASGFLTYLLAIEKISWDYFFEVVSLYDTDPDLETNYDTS